MKIEIISVSALDEGAEILLTVKISNGEGRGEKRKLLLFTEQYLEMGLCRGAVIDADTFDELEKLSRECKLTFLLTPHHPKCVSRKDCARRELIKKAQRMPQIACKSSV